MVYSSMARNKRIKTQNVCASRPADVRRNMNEILKKDFLEICITTQRGRDEDKKNLRKKYLTRLL